MSSLLIVVKICNDLFSSENVPTRNSDVDYRFLEAAKAGDLDTVQVNSVSSGVDGDYS